MVGLCKKKGKMSDAIKECRKVIKELIELHKKAPVDE